MTPSNNDTTCPRVEPARTRRREQLIATLEALIYNDDVDLDLFQPGVPWPQARNITQQPHTPFRAIPEERSHIQADYKDDRAFDSAMGNAGEYSNIYSEPSYFLQTQQNGGTDKASSWFPQAPKIGFESSATTIPSYIAPPPPTPPLIHHQEDRSGSHCLTSAGFGEINPQEHDVYIEYDFSKPLATPPTRASPEDAYPSISKSSSAPLLDFMSWDMFMDYVHVPSPETNNMTNHDSANSADDFCIDRKISGSARANENEPPTKSPSENGSRVAKATRRRNHRQVSKSSSPPPRPCGGPSQATEKGCQPKSHRAHSAIEKRYRAGINEKFEALRSCIESRKMPKQEPLGHTLSEASKENESGGATTAVLDRKKGAGGSSDAGGRMNKAEVLSEATEYILQLEDENSLMLDQLKILVQRLRATRMALQPMTPISNT